MWSLSLDFWREAFWGIDFCIRASKPIAPILIQKQNKKSIPKTLVTFGLNPSFFHSKFKIKLLVIQLIWKQRQAFVSLLEFTSFVVRKLLDFQQPLENPPLTHLSQSTIFLLRLTVSPFAAAPLAGENPFRL